MDAEQLASLAIDALRRSSLHEAERLGHRAYKTAPRDARIVWTYGAIMQARGSYSEAARLFRRLVEMQAEDAGHWMNLATALRATGQYEEALRAYETAGQLGERSADYFYNLALLQMDLSDARAALANLREAARISPRDSEIRFDYSRICFLCVETEETQQSLRDWQQWQKWTAERYAGVAALLLQMGEQCDAEAIIGHLDRMPERTMAVELRVIGMLERLNRLDEAKRRMAALPPEPAANDADIQRRLAVEAQLAQRGDDTERAERLYRDLLQMQPDPAERERFLFPLAKVLDERKQYVDAIETIAQAHDVQWMNVERSGIASFEDEQPIMAITAYGCNVEDVAAWTEQAPPDRQHSPIFIVAFPRSGTTLLEQMLDAHPALQTMDEQPFLQKTTLQFGERGITYPEAMRHADADTLSEIRRYYWLQVGSKLQLRPGQRLIDKNPLNMLRLPAIRRLFPHAPILLAIRHPCDVIISNYFQHYRAPEFVRLCRDLPSLALAYRKAFDFWYHQVAILKPCVREIRYESFVADFEQESYRISQFLELDWHEAMLRPAEHARRKGYISTPSYSQVVQPVSTKAVGRWRRYEAHMAPVIAEVRPYLQRWAYDS